MVRDYDQLLVTILHEETRKQAELYFQKYWLDEDEYFEKWRPIQDAIFNDKAKYLPHIMFNVGFELFPMVGGDIFVAESDFRVLQNCLLRTGDEHFAVVQNRNVVIEGYDSENNSFLEDPFTRFKYAVDISWDELMSGGVVGSEHFHNGRKDYFVFGDSGNWGRYVANSWIQPSNQTGFNSLNIMGFKEQFSEIFRQSFERVRQLEPEITPEILFSQWLPENYKEQIIRSNKI